MTVPSLRPIGPARRHQRRENRQTVVRKFCCTDSTEVGEVRLTPCAKSVKKTSMELGGVGALPVIPGQPRACVRCRPWR
jgi:hypothetical protein